MAKVCSKCKQRKPLASFSKNKREADGHFYYCKECDMERKKKFYKENKSKILKSRKKYYGRESEAIRTRVSLYRKNNKQKVKEAKRRYDIENWEKVYKRQTRWRKKNIQRVRAYSRTYLKKYRQTAMGKAMIKKGDLRRRMREKETDIKTRDIAVLFAKAIDYGVCPLCYKKPRVWHLEHATPLGGGRGGTNTKDNVYFCCATCNMRKHTKTLEEFAGISFRDLPVTL